jgi:hypothetical protein
VPTSHKLEFPKFDGTSDPLPWLNCCEYYFNVRRTLDHQRVSFITFYLDDAQLWFHHIELNGGRMMWDQIVNLINARFGPPLIDSPLSEQAMLRLTGTVNEFNTQFMALSCHDPTLLEAQQV